MERKKAYRNEKQTLRQERLPFAERFVQLDLRENRVVGSFLGNLDIVGVALLESCPCNAHKLCLIVQLLDICTACVAHARAQAAQQLEDGVRQRPLIRDPALNPFGYKFLLLALEIAVAAASAHGPQTAHAPVDLALLCQPLPPVLSQCRRCT